MKTMILWLMGDNLGELLIRSWNWLWQIPVAEPPATAKTSDNIALEHAQQLLESIALRVIEMQKAVDRMRQSTREIKRQYDAKCQHYQELLGMALEFKKCGEMVEARMAMAKAIGIERILPELQARLEHAQEMLVNINECHSQEQAKLAVLEMEMETIKACIVMNESIHGRQDLDQTNDLNNLQDKFRHVQVEIEDRYRQIQVMSQLAGQSQGITDEPLNMQDIDNRLQALAGQGGQTVFPTNQS